MDAPPITREELDEVYNWVDEIPFSRPKKNIARDFADGMLAAEIMHYYFPRLVDLHNYPPANSATQKYNNWNTLNRTRSSKLEKALKKINFQISKNDIEHIITCTPDSIERMLRQLKLKIQSYLEKNREKERAKEDELKLGSDSGKNMSPVMIRNELGEKELAIKELRETVEILQLKLKKMEQLSKLKDAKIQTLVSKLQQAGLE